MPTISASSPVGVVRRAAIALIERLPLAAAAICTGALSTSWLSEPSERRVPVWATTTRLCCEPSAPIV
jgi:hypothetical protein